LATEDLYPDGLQASGWTGTAANIDEDIDTTAPDGALLYAPSDNTTVRITFPTPSGDPTTGTDDQQIRVMVGKQDAGAKSTSGGDPTLDLYIYENGTSRVTLATAVDVYAAVGNDGILSYNWTYSGFTNSDGSGVELYLSNTKGGGGPNERNCYVESVEWIASYTSGATPKSGNDTLYPLIAEGTVDFAKATSDTLLPRINEGTVEFAKLTYDSLSPYVTEDVDLLLLLSSSDFLTIGYVDESSLAVLLSSSDTIYPRIDEGAVAFGKYGSDFVLTRIDEGAVGFGKSNSDILLPRIDEQPIGLGKYSSDILLPNIEDVLISLALPKAANDILFTKLDEGTVYFSKATIDTLLPQILESTGILGTISSSDTLYPYILDSSSVLGVISASDFLLPRVDEGAVAIAVALSANDELLPEINEGIVSFAKITSDALNITVLDSSSLLALLSSADEILIAIDDNGIVGGGILKNASDTIYIAFADEFGNFEKATADALTIALAENTAFDTINVAKSDTLLITFGLGRYLDDGTARVTRYRRMAKGKGIGIGIK